MTLVSRTGRPKRSLLPPRKQRAVLENHIRIAPTNPNKLRFTFSGDVIEKLAVMHMGLFGAFYWQIADPRERWRTLRLQFVRFADVGVPAVFVMIEPPTYDPHGKRIHRSSPTSGNSQFYAEIVATKLKVKHAMLDGKSFIANHYWAEQGAGGLNGIVIDLPTYLMEYDGPKLPVKSSGIHPRDLVAY